MTEVGVNCFAMTVEDSVSKLGSIGKPMMHTEVRLVATGQEADDEGAPPRDVETGEVGEMWFRGPHVSLGYWNRPEATAASYLPDGWFRSGDLARRDEDGFFYIAGRAKDMIISGGVNIYPAEIESGAAPAPGRARRRGGGDRPPDLGRGRHRLRRAPRGPRRGERSGAGSR